MAGHAAAIELQNDFVTRDFAQVIGISEFLVQYSQLAGGKTKFTVSWAPHNASAEEEKTFDDGRNSMTQGWNGTLEQLEAYLATAK